MKNTIALLILHGWLMGAHTSTTTYEERSPLFHGTHTENFVIRWGFQNACNHAFDQRSMGLKNPQLVTFDPTQVQPGDIILVRNAPKFFATLHKEIHCPYIIVTLGSYFDRMHEKFLKFLDDEKVIAWYGVHPCIQSHPKFHALPLGILQRTEFYEKRDELTQLFAQLRQEPRKKLLHMNFTVRSKPPFKGDRNQVITIFENKPFCHKASHRPFIGYMQEMAEYKFTLSPRGTAPDTYRTWEALMVGTIPIVKTSHLDELYAKLPVLIIEDWEQVTEEFLEHKYQEMVHKKCDIEKLFMEYWLKKINTTRDKFFLQHYAA